MLTGESLHAQYAVPRPSYAYTICKIMAPYLFFFLYIVTYLYRKSCKCMNDVMRYLECVEEVVLVLHKVVHLQADVLVTFMQCKLDKYFSFSSMY